MKRRVRGRIEQPSSWPITPRQGGIARCGARPFRKDRVVYGLAEAGSVPSSAYPLEVELPQGGSTPHGRPEYTLERYAAPRRKSGAREPNDLWVLVSWIGCRSRCEVSFLHCQGEPQGQPRQSRIIGYGGSTKTIVDLALSDEKGAETERANFIVNANQLRSAEKRLRFNPTKGVLGHSSLSL